MPSLRKKVAGFIRHLSVANQTENVPVDQTDTSPPSTSSCFIQRYLNGHDIRQHEPNILHGRLPHELPRKLLGPIITGSGSVVSALTGPDGGLTTVNQRQRHLSISDPDVDYIDILEQKPENERVTVASSDCIFSRSYGRWFRPPQGISHPIDNSVMHIRAAGSVFAVGSQSVHTSVSDLSESPLGRYPCKELSESRDDLTLNFTVTSSSPPPTTTTTTQVNHNVADVNYHLMHAKSELNGNKPPDTLTIKQSILAMTPNNHQPGSLDSPIIPEDLVIPPPAEYATSPEPMVGSLRKSKSAPQSGGKGLSRIETDGPWDQLSSLNKNETIAGVSEWGRLHPDAYGIATTLYERHPLTGINAGHPIADCFAVVVRSNSAILALADGVNWGEKACVAARSAIHGCVAYLTRSLFQDNEPVTNTTEVFVALLRSFHEAHSLILQEQGMLTTLTAAVVIPLQPGRGGTYVACLCNVGDSLAYVYSQTHGVREITKGSHDIHCMRDMRDALGALGPVDGQNPELNNLTCSMTELDEGDIVFLTSDGISDNFDPVVGKFAVLPTNNEQQQSSGNSQTPGTPDPASGLPVVQAYQRHELSLLRMDDLLRHGVSGEEQPCADTKQLCEMLVDFATRLTAAKRHILEDPDLYVVETSEGVKELSKAEQRQRRRQVCEKLSMVPGKLDHATVVAFKVGTREKITDLPKETDH